MTDRNEKRGVSSGLEAFTLVSQLGLTIAIPILLGAVGGHWLDKKLDTGMVFFLILICLGIAGGFISAYHQIKKIR